MCERLALISLLPGVRTSMTVPEWHILSTRARPSCTLVVALFCGNCSSTYPGLRHGSPAHMPPTARDYDISFSG